MPWGSKYKDHHPKPLRGVSAHFPLLFCKWLCPGGMAEGWQSGPFGKPSPSDRRASCPRMLHRAALNPSGCKRLWRGGKASWPASPAAPDVSEADLLSFVAWPGFTSSPNTISGKWATGALAFYRVFNLPGESQLIFQELLT